MPGGHNTTLRMQRGWLGGGNPFYLCEGRGGDGPLWSQSVIPERHEKSSGERLQARRGLGAVGSEGAQCEQYLRQLLQPQSLIQHECAHESSAWNRPPSRIFRSWDG